MLVENPARETREPFAYHQRRSCRVCGSERLSSFLSLGSTALANSFVAKEDTAVESYYPLDVYFCETCSLVQLVDVVDPEVLFKHYIYVTGTSDTILAHNVDYARTMVELLRLDWNDLVVEVASNDGSLLKCFRNHGVRTLGVEPASNIAAIAQADGIETVNQFFDLKIACHIRGLYGGARVVIGNNVLAHVDNPTELLQGCRELLQADGLAVIEVPYVKDMIENLEYDTIYHEHLSYFSLNTLLRLCDSADLSVQRVDYVPVHGGSLRIYAGLPRYYGTHAAKVLAMAEQEQRSGLTSLSRYERFAVQVASNRRTIRTLLEDLKRDGRTVAGYGAPAKGNTLLNYCKIGPELLPYTVDKNPLKVGMYTPGMHIPVLPVSTLLEQQPDYVLILAWNFAQEIIEQQREYRARGGQFIIPLPEPRRI